MIQTRCEKCGKRYRVDENKILGYRAKFQCTACQNTVFVIKPPPKYPPADKTTPWHESTVILKRESYFESGEWERMKISLPKEEKPHGFRLASKLLILTLILALVPLILFFVIYLKQMQTVAGLNAGRALIQAVYRNYDILGIILFFWVLGAWLSIKLLTWPLTKLTRLANRMSLGDLNVEIPEDGKGEIGQLSRALFRLQASLKLSIKALERSD
jgi:HAMP domain-containing protein